jgi:hypothetical protein
MSTIDKGGSFWVIEGVKVKKKEPFRVAYVPRVINESPEKPAKADLQ